MIRRQPFFIHTGPTEPPARDRGSRAEMGTGGGLFRPLDGACDYTQSFRVKNDLRILG